MQIWIFNKKGMSKGESCFYPAVDYFCYVNTNKNRISRRKQSELQLLRVSLSENMVFKEVESVQPENLLFLKTVRQNRNVIRMVKFAVIV